MTAPGTPEGQRQLLGRYALFGELAAGGMATVHLGRLMGPVGFTKTVAIKRLHEQFARDPEFTSMFLDEARLAARIRHPNVVATLDVVKAEGELFLIMDYIEGESLSHILKALAKRGEHMDPKLVGAIVGGALQGLHSAHKAKDERGQPLGIVHRDVSPQNVLVGIDGITRVLDFGVAKARGRLQTTRGGQLKGKLNYMAPEQVEGENVDRRTDVYAASVMLWETLTGKRLITADNEAAILTKVLKGEFKAPSTISPWVTPALDSVVMRGLAADPQMRFQSARDMAIELDRAVDGAASPYKVAEWVEQIAGDALAIRAGKVREMESSSAVHSLRPADRPQRKSVPEAPPPTPAPARRSYAKPPPSHPAAPPPSRLAPPPPPAGASLPSEPEPSVTIPSPPVVDEVSARTSGIEFSKPPFDSAPPEEVTDFEVLDESAPKGNRARTLAIVGLVILALIAITLWALKSEPQGVRVTPLEPSGAELQAPEPEAEAEAELAPEPEMEVEPEPEMEAAPEPEVAEPAAEAEPATKRKTRPTTRKHRGRCSPPFFYDSDGVKHFKPECL